VNVKATGSDYLCLSPNASEVANHATSSRELPTPNPHLQLLSLSKHQLAAQEVSASSNSIPHFHYRHNKAHHYFARLPRPRAFRLGFAETLSGLFGSSLPNQPLRENVATQIRSVDPPEVPENTIPPTDLVSHGKLERSPCT